MKRWRLLNGCPGQRKGRRPGGGGYAARCCRPIAATELALCRAGMSLAQIDRIEINAAFARAAARRT